MQKKANSPISYLKDKKHNSVFELYFWFSELKVLYRQGWLKYLPSEKCESVADHTMGVMVLTTFLADKFFEKPNYEKLMKMAMIHDLAEAIVGDLITGIGNENPDNKQERELVAIEKIFENIENKHQYIELFKEYHERKSKEAIFVKKMDKLELYLQATIYEKETKQKLVAFFDHAHWKFDYSDIADMIEEIEQLRK